MLPSNHHKWGMGLCCGISEVTDPVPFPAQTVWPYRSKLASQTESLCKSIFLFQSVRFCVSLCSRLSWDPGTCSVDQAGVEGLPHHCWREPLLKAEFSHCRLALPDIQLTSASHPVLLSVALQERPSPTSEEVSAACADAVPMHPAALSSDGCRP